MTTDNGYKMRKSSGPAVLLHITTEDRIESIRATGLKASDFGDIDVVRNDGAGLYAVLPQRSVADPLVCDLFCGEEVYGILFEHEGDYFICDGVENTDWNDDRGDSDGSDSSFSSGYVVIPASGGSVVVPPEKILDIRPYDSLFEKDGTCILKF